MLGSAVRSGCVEITLDVMDLGQDSTGGAAGGSTPAMPRECVSGAGVSGAAGVGGSPATVNLEGQAQGQDQTQQGSVVQQLQQLPADQWLEWLQAGRVAEGRPCSVQASGRPWCIACMCMYTYMWD